MVLLILSTWTMLCPAGKRVLGLADEAITLDPRLTKAQFDLVGVAFFSSFPLGAVMIGCAANRLAPRVLLACPAGAWGVAMALVAMVSTLSVLFVGRSLLGLVEGPTALLATHAVQTWFSEARRALSNAVVQMVSTIGKSHRSHAPLPPRERP